MLRIRLAAAVLALGVLSQRASAQLLTNGGFETGSLTGWTLTGSSCATGVLDGGAHTGSYSLLSGPVAGTCSVAQSFATTAGEQYTFSFWVANQGNSGPNSFEARWDGGSLYSTVNAPSFGYTQQQFTVSATAPTTTIDFVIRHDPTFYLLDDVRVAAVSTVPEPSTYALMAAGLLGIMAVRRRRSRA